MVWWQIALGIVVGGAALIALKYVFKFIITFVVICKMSPLEYELWKMQNSIFEWE